MTHMIMITNTWTNRFILDEDLTLGKTLAMYDACLKLIRIMLQTWNLVLK